MDCPFSLNHNCGHHEDAGVRCTLSIYGNYHKGFIQQPSPSIRPHNLWLLHACSMYPACVHIQCMFSVCAGDKYYFNKKNIYALPSCGCKPELKTHVRMWLFGLVYPGCTSGEVRLAGSSSSSTRGRVELCHNNQWGTIRDDNWGNSDAEVICKQLKYSSYGIINL